MAIELQQMDLDLVIAKLSALDQLDELIGNAKFASLTKTDDELSLVIDRENLPNHEYANEGWKAFKIIGPLDFSLVGILQQVIKPLSDSGISIFSISTFDTDYILVKREQHGRAREILEKTFRIS